MTRFSKLTFVNGRPVETDVRDIKQSDIAKCPHTIFAAEHYREDGSCKCNDPNETIMKTWGYEWVGGQWRSSVG